MVVRAPVAPRISHSLNTPVGGNTRELDTITSRRIEYMFEQTTSPATTFGRTYVRLDRLDSPVARSCEGFTLATDTTASWTGECASPSRATREIAHQRSTLRTSR